MTQNTPVQTIESLDLTLEKLFNDFYVVPSFQREYVWETEQVEQLLNDIYDEFTEDQGKTEYFIGSLVVCPGQDGTLDLIDGQQRMTTSYLFLCAVRDRLKALGDTPPNSLNLQIAAFSMNANGEEISRYRVTLQYEDSRGFLVHIAENGANFDQLTDGTRSVRNMLNAYQTIETFLTTQFGDDVNALRRFYVYYTTRVKLVRIKTPSVAHALKVFETINDRGVGLDAMDLLKNLMFMNASPVTFDKLKEHWKSLVDTLYKANEKPLRFLRYFIFANYGVDRLKEDQIYNWFVRYEQACGYAQNPIAFVERLRKSALAYTRFVEGKNADGSVNRYLVNIGYLSGAARQHLVLLLAGMHLNKDAFTELCRQLENLYFVYIITREPTKEFERRFARWAPRIQQIQDRQQLDEFVQTTIRPAKEGFSTRFRLAFEELHEGAIQKYRMRYILGKLTQHVNEEALGGQADLDLGKFAKQKDIEHILAQTPTTETRQSFDKPDEIEAYIHLLGNLTLLESTINSSIRNRPFGEKRQAYAKSTFLLTRSLVEDLSVGVNTAINRAIDGLLRFDEWTAESIELRQLMLADLAESVWEMPPARRAAGGPDPKGRLPSVESAP